MEASELRRGIGRGKLSLGAEKSPVLQIAKPQAKKNSFGKKGAMTLDFFRIDKFVLDKTPKNRHSFLMQGILVRLKVFRTGQTKRQHSGHNPLLVNTALKIVSHFCLAQKKMSSNII